MTKEELLKIYSAYLPYGLKLIDNVNIVRELTHKGYWHRSSEDDTVFIGVDEAIEYDLKPILYPLDFLTKEIEHDGEKIIPAEFVFGKNHNIREVKDVYLINKNGYSFRAVDLSFKQVQKLLELHFNIFSLPEDKYINKATLNHENTRIKS